MQVLNRGGVSVSKLIREVFGYMEATRSLLSLDHPGAEREADSKQAEIERKRSMVWSWVEAVPPPTLTRVGSSGSGSKENFARELSHESLLRALVAGG